MSGKKGSRIEAMKPGILVAPTEPAALKALGRVSLVAERWGSDVLIPSLRLGIQRKQVSDLVASLTDGRLTKEMLQMKRLVHRVLVVEGRFAWTADGEWVNGFTRFTRKQYWGALMSVQEMGVKVIQTSDINETVQAVEECIGWAKKKSHTSLEGRAKGGLVSKWGTREDKDWQMFLAQGFDGIGPTQARAIVEYFGGVPLQWTVTEKELQKVKGIGRERARGLMRALENGKGGKEDCLAIIEHEAEFFLKMSRTDAWRNHAQVLLDAARVLHGKGL